MYVANLTLASGATLSEITVPDLKNIEENLKLMSIHPQY